MFLTSSKLAAEIGVTKNTVIKMANSGAIPSIRLPVARGDFRFVLEDVVAALKKHTSATTGDGTPK